MFDFSTRRPRGGEYGTLDDSKRISTAVVRQTRRQICEAVILACLNYHENVNSYAYSKLKGRVNGNEYDCVDC